MSYSFLRSGAIAVCLCFFCSLSAQDLQYSIYFNSGQHQLSQESEVYLQKLLAQLDKIPDYALDIRAYTDDVGSQQYNKNLALKRAFSVANYLESKGIQPTTQAVNGLGEVQLDNEENVQAARRANRRVDILVSPFHPQDLSEVDAFFRKRNTTQKTIDVADRDVMVRTANGTRLMIPQNSLVAKDGRGIRGKKIQINIQEAFQYEAMLLHNLPTLSDGRLLQTGGMLNITAQTEDGIPVEVAPGAELQLSIPSSSALPDSMQLFVGAEGAAGAINWKPTGRPFVSPPKLDKFYVPKEYPRMDVQLPQLMPFVDVRLERPLPPPIKVQAVDKPALDSNEYLAAFQTPPTKEAVQQQLSREKGESKKDFQERIDWVFKHKKQKYFETKNAFNRAKLNYDQDLADYQKYKEQQKTEARYNKERIQQEKDYQAFKAWVNQHQDSLNQIIKIYNQLSDLKDVYAQMKKMSEYLGRTFQTKESLLPFLKERGLYTAEVKNAFSSLGRYEYHTRLIVRRLSGLDYFSIIDDLTLEKPDAIFSTYTDLATMFSIVDELRGDFKRYQQLMESKVIKEVKQALTILTELNDEIIAIERELEYKAYAQWWENQNYDQLTTAEQQQYDMLSWKAKVDFIDFQINETAALQRIKVIKEWEADFLEELGYYERRSYQLMSQKEQFDYISCFMKNNFRNIENQVGISQLGWINCDRFYEVENRTELVVESSKHPDLKTRYYVCFKDIKAVMPLSGIPGKPQLRAAGLPANAKVEIVGICVEAGQVQISKTQGSIESLHNKKLQPFRAASMAQIGQLL